MNRTRHISKSSFLNAENLLNLRSRLTGSSSPDSLKVLDVGCGAGDLVNEFLRLEHDSYGCDLRFKKGLHTAKLVESSRLVAVNDTDYSFPFEDSHFDLVISNQVMDHVVDHNVVFDEIERVLRPGGVTVHVFPPKWRVVEVHTGIPFSSVFRPIWYIKLWQVVISKRVVAPGILGSDAEVAQEYLNRRTNYLTRKQLNSLMSNRFSKYGFCTRDLLMLSKYKRLDSLFKYFPGAYFLLSEFYLRAIFGVK